MQATETGRAGRRRLIAALVLAYAQFAVLLNSVGTVILQSINSFHVSKTDAAILEAFKDLPIAIVSVCVAAFLTRLGIRRAIMAGLAIVAIGCIAMPLMPGFGTAKLLFLLTGVSFALVKTGTYTAIGLVTDSPSDHASLTNLIEGLFMVGVLSGYWIFGAFIDSAHPASLSWLNTYWVLAAMSLAILALVAISPLDESAAQASGSTPAEDVRAMVALLARPTVIVFVVSVFLYVLIEQGVGTWLPTFNAEVLHLPAAMSVQAASLFAAALAIGRLSAGGLIRVVGWLPVLALCIIGIIATIFIVVPMAAQVTPRPGMNWFNAPLAAFAMPLIGLFLAPIYPTINSAILSSLPKARHAAMTGLIIAFSALGGTLGSFLTGRIFAELGGARAFSLIVVPTIILAVALLLFHRLVSKDGVAKAVAEAS